MNSPEIYSSKIAYNTEESNFNMELINETNFSFGMSKVDAFENEHRNFLEELKKLCKSVGLTCTPNLRKEIGKITQRKDGHISYCYRIFFQTHLEKIIAFNRDFPLKYAIDKKRRLNEELDQAIGFRKQRENYYLAKANNF